MTRRLAPEVRGAIFGHPHVSFRALVLATAVYFAFFNWAFAAELKAVDAASRPDFSLHDLDGRLVSLRDAGGTTLLVHFFATWCEPCREELPALTRLRERSNGKASVLAISVAENGQRVGRFFQHSPVDFPVLLDLDRAVAKAWGITTLPSTYVLDATLRPRWLVEADYPWDSVGFGRDGQFLIKPTSE